MLHIFSYIVRASEELRIVLNCLFLKLSFFLFSLIRPHATPHTRIPTLHTLRSPHIDERKQEAERQSGTMPSKRVASDGEEDAENKRARPAESSDEGEDDTGWWCATTPDFLRDYAYTLQVTRLYVHTDGCLSAVEQKGKNSWTGDVGTAGQLRGRACPYLDTINRYDFYTRKRGSCIILERYSRHSA